MENKGTSVLTIKRLSASASLKGCHLGSGILWFIFYAIFGYAIFSAIFSAIVTPAIACERPTLATTWINPEAALKELSRLKIDYNCGEKPIKAYDPLSASLWIVRGYMQCGRAECIWGRAKGETQPSGEMWVTFSAFSTIRKLKLNQESGLLKVDVETIYRDERRAPLKQSFYLHPEQ